MAATLIGGRAGPWTPSPSEKDSWLEAGGQVGRLPQSQDGGPHQRTGREKGTAIIWRETG